ncbi:CLUMA_CG010847, isoform A [Clunio marinus]|uniref:CLUMA_CG010847, isoform A n=1 Tax=Clunio marinus TaxID=568069 RepID=A0A1J1ICH6_9DIPT|nr:CLUMA_CG010847, isoform A [Clunio marinus]
MKQKSEIDCVVESRNSSQEFIKEYIRSRTLALKRTENITKYCRHHHKETDRETKIISRFETCYYVLHLERSRFGSVLKFTLDPRKVFQSSGSNNLSFDLEVVCKMAYLKPFFKKTA